MILNVLTRTHRQQYFEVCKKSILSQTAVESINWIVGSDIDCQYYPAIKLTRDNRVPDNIPQHMYFAPWNAYLDYLQTYVREGLIMYLDDDDAFTTIKSAQRIINAVDNDNQLLVWKVQITPDWIVPSQSFGKYIQAGDFSGIGMAFNVKHLPVTWGNLSYGDYRVASQLINKGLKPKFIDMVLTTTQKGAHNGR
jgi:hypothetical protein